MMAELTASPKAPFASALYFFANSYDFAGSSIVNPVNAAAATL
jgi:hypothetical protein